MKTLAYKDYRENIRSGDLLIWSEDNYSVISNAILTSIRVLTSSDYAHVGIAIRMLGRLFVVEATMPTIRLALVSDKEEFYHVPVDVTWSHDCEDYLFSKLGLPYSIIDDIRAYFGLVAQNDNKYQCAELAREFYVKCCNLPISENYIPKSLIKEILQLTESSIHFVKKIPDGEA
jgi:hypothetical protein